MSVIIQRAPREVGPKSNKRQCMKCGLYKQDALFTMNANGQMICPDCAGLKHGAVLRQSEELVSGPDPARG